MINKEVSRMKKKDYEYMLRYINNHKIIKESLIILSTLSPILIIVSYCIVVIVSFLNQTSLFKITLIPLITLLLVSLLRSLINKPRPFEEFDFQPLVAHSIGKSFPSRHTACACIIALTFIYLQHPFSYIMIGVALVVALTRVLTGVHRISDVLVAILISSICGLLGFYVI